MLDNSCREYRDLGIMADSQVTACYEGLFQSQSAVWQILHIVDEHLQSQVVPSPPLQLYGAYKFWCVPKLLYLCWS